MKFENTLAFARQLDEEDTLKKFRDRFYIPIVNGKECIYFTGNSLGLQPKTTQDYVLTELEDWANYGVEGHFHAKNPWVSYHEIFPELIAPIVGALPEGLRKDAEMYAGCVSGAIQKNVYMELIHATGFENVTIQKEKAIIIPDDILVNYLSASEITAFKSGSTGIMSITVFAQKPLENKTACVPGGGCC
jgi:kynureninase